MQTFKDGQKSTLRLEQAGDGWRLNHNVVAAYHYFAYLHIQTCILFCYAYGIAMVFI